MTQEKPNIQRLFDAVNRFNRDAREVVKSGKYKAYFKCRDDFKATLQELGVDDAFDWSEEE